MAIDYRRMKKTATRLVTGAGRDWTITRKGEVRMVRGVEVTDPDEVLMATGVRTEYALREIDGVRVLTGDLRIVFTADVELRLGDLVAVDGQQYRIVAPNPVKPADELICYRAQLRV